MQKAPTYTLIGPVKELITLAGIPDKGPVADALLNPLQQGGILTKNDKIYKTGIYTDLLQEADELHAKHITLENDYIALPGFIDAHTHICFAGTRAKDYALRNSGKTYLEIAEAGGGIWDTVQQTRKTCLDELTQLTVLRTGKLLAQGITTVEVKSGYGLSVEEELKMLRAIKDAKAESPIDIISTCLAAHMLPKDFDGTHEEYLQLLINELFPVIKEENLTHRIDAFVEKSAFSAEQIIPYFLAAKVQGFQITVHADQFSTSGSAVAVAIGAQSADHLEASDDAEIQLLANSAVVAVALPGASLGLGCGFTPARKLLDAGCCLAIASDWNPGSAPMGNLLVQAAILGTFEKLTNAEVFAGITLRAAKALGLTDRGRLQEGALADIVLFQTNDHREILYRQGSLKPAMVFKNGHLIYSSTHNDDDI